MPRPRKPARLKELAGNPGKRPIGKEPEPPPYRGDCPAHLDGFARSEWIRLRDLLEAMKVFTAADTGILEDYCIAAAQLREAAAKVKREGAVIKTPFGRQKNPWVAVQKDAFERKEKAGSKLGLSPADRARLAVAPPKGEDDPERKEIEDFFKTGKPSEQPEARA